MSDINFNFTPL